MRQYCKSVWNFLLIFPLFFTVSVHSQEFTIETPLPFYAGFMAADEAHETIFLIVHGTFAHKDMEIVQAFQEALSEQSYSSLAITLPLGTPLRKNFQDCNNIAQHTHQDALLAIDSSVNWIQQNHPGKSIILLGHSRGGNQVVLYSRNYPLKVKAVVAVAPMVFNKNNITPLPEATDSTRIALSQFLHCNETEVDIKTVISYRRDETQNTPSLLLKSGPPVKVIFGDEDRLYPRFTTMSDKLKLKVDIEVVNGADHFFRDLYAEDAVDIMISFVEDL